MADDIVTLQLQGDQCTIAMPPDAWLKVKVYSPSGCPVLTQPRAPGEKRRLWDSDTSNERTLTLKTGDTLRIDVYGGDGEVCYLRAEYQMEAGQLAQRRMVTLTEGVRIEVKAATESKDYDPAIMDERHPFYESGSED